MLKLGKKNHEVIETIEAYNCACSGKINCWEYCGDSDSEYGGENDYYYDVSEARQLNRA